MKQKILATRTIPQEAIEGILDRFEVTMPEPEKDIFTKEEVMSMLPGYDVLFSINEYPVTEDMMTCSSRLKVIANNGAGYNHIDADAATRHGLAVINPPHAVQMPTAELTIALMLSITRGIVMYDKELREKRHCRKDMFFERDMPVEGKTMGILGMGNIGKKVAQLATALGMKICYHNRHRLSEEIEAQYEATYLSLEDLLKTSDVVTVNVPLYKENYHLINRENIKLMKPTAYLVNAARGPIVEERALLDALKNKAIRGAALDVFEFEPEIGEEMAAIDNIVIVPHVGTNIRKTRINMLKESLSGMDAYLSGRHPHNLVNPSVLDK